MEICVLNVTMFCMDAKNIIVQLTIRFDNIFTKTGYAMSTVTPSVSLIFYDTADRVYF